MVQLILSIKRGSVYEGQINTTPAADNAATSFISVVTELMLNPPHGETDLTQESCLVNWILPPLSPSISI